MSWKFPPSLFGGNQQEQTGQNPQHIPTESWYPPSVFGSAPNPSDPSRIPGPNLNRALGRQSSLSAQPSPSDAASVIACLKDKGVDELRKLLNDRDAYAAFFNSLEQVQMQNSFLGILAVLGLRPKSNEMPDWCLVSPQEGDLLEAVPRCLEPRGKVRDELRKETLQLAGDNLEKEPQILELRNQCMIIRTTELAAAQEKLNELEKQKEDISRFYSPSSLLKKLQDAMERSEEESMLLERQLLEKEIDLATFLQRYKKLRQVYHRRALVHLAARTS